MWTQSGSRLVRRTSSEIWMAMTFPWKACFVHMFTGGIFAGCITHIIAQARYYLSGCRRQPGPLSIHSIVVCWYTANRRTQYNSQTKEAGRSFERFASFLEGSDHRSTHWVIQNKRLAQAGHYRILDRYESLHFCDWTVVYGAVHTVAWAARVNCHSYAVFVDRLLYCICGFIYTQRPPGYELT